MGNDSEVKPKNLRRNPFDRFVDPASNGTKGWYYKGPRYLWTPIIESYVEAQVALHLHFVAPFRGDKGPSGSGDCDPKKYCVIHEWPQWPSLHREGLNPAHERWKLQMRHVKRRGRKMERAVLVEVGEFVQVPEGTLDALPCTKRL